jgi:hypothetical protein
MSHYPAILRSQLGKAIGNSSSTNNETDENSTIKNLIYKHVSKVQLPSTTNSIGNKGTMRGILGEVGNMSLSNKPIISKPKIIQQQTNSIAALIESQSIVNILPPAPPPPLTTTTNIAIQIEEIIVDDIDDDDDDDIESLIEIPAEFDCDSGDILNINTASEFVVDICKYWRELEQLTPIRQNFLLQRREGRGKQFSFYYAQILLV